MRDGWIETSLGEIADVVGGGTPSTKIGEYWDGDIVWLTPTEIASQDGKVVSDSIRKITDLGFKNSGAQMLPINSVILTSRASVGFVALSGKELCTNQGFQSLIPKPSVLSKFIMFWIQQNRSEFESRSAGSTFKEISKSNVKSIKIQLPPLPEQKRIVDLISSVDSYIEALQQQLESAKKSRSAVLHKTFHIDGSNWKLKKLVECTQKISDGSHNPPKGIEVSDFLMLSSKDVWDGDLTNLDPRFLKQSDFELENKRTQLESGDVLLTIVGTIGRCTVYRGYPKNVTFQRSVCVIKTSKEILNESYLMLYLQSIQSYLDQNARGVAQRGIYLNQIRELEIPIPSLNEQLEVVSNIDVFDAFIRETQKVVAQTQKLRAAMLSELLSGIHEIPPNYDKVIGAA